MLVTDLFFEPLHAAEQAKRRRAGLLRAHPSRYVLGDLSLDVKPKLVVDLAGSAAAEHERADA